MGRPAGGGVLIENSINMLVHQLDSTMSSLT